MKSNPAERSLRGRGVGRVKTVAASFYRHLNFIKRFTIRRIPVRLSDFGSPC